MKFANIAKGKLNVTEHVFPGSPPEAQAKVGLRVLTGVDDATVLEGAQQFAVDRKAEAVTGNPIYDLGFMVHALRLACVDTDAPSEPFFADIAEVMTLDRDRISYLFEAQQVWQDKCAPRPLKMTEVEFMGTMLAIATDETERPFLALRPGTRWSCMRTMASLWLNSLSPKSDFTAGFTTIGDTSTQPSSQSSP